jgi:hypothetical protein
MIPYDQQTYRVGGDYWYHATGVGTSAATALSTGVQYFIPVRIDNEITIKSIGVEATATAATAVAQIGVYKDAGKHYPRPGELITQVGTNVNVAAAAFAESSTAECDITSPGLYWFSIVNQTAAATVRTFSLVKPCVPLALGTTEPAAVGVTVAYTISSITAAALVDVSATATLAGVTLAPWLYMQVD